LLLSSLVLFSALLQKKEEATYTTDKPALKFLDTPQWS